MVLLVHHQEGVDVMVPHTLDAEVAVQIAMAGDGLLDHEVRHPDELRGVPDPLGADKTGDEIVGGVFEDLFWRVKLQNVPVAHDANAVGDLDGLVHVVGDKNHGFSHLFVH